MLYNVYSIRDTKTGYMSPLVDVNHAAAVRNFYHSVINADSILRTYSVDFELYHIGGFDSDSGELIPQVPEFVASGADAFRNMATGKPEVSA